MARNALIDKTICNVRLDRIAVKDRRDKTDLKGHQEQKAQSEMTEHHGPSVPKVRSVLKGQSVPKGPSGLKGPSVPTGQSVPMGRIVPKGQSEPMGRNVPKGQSVPMGPSVRIERNEPLDLLVQMGKNESYLAIDPRKRNVRRRLVVSEEPIEIPDQIVAQSLRMGHLRTNHPDSEPASKTMILSVLSTMNRKSIMTSRLSTIKSNRIRVWTSVTKAANGKRVLGDVAEGADDPSLATMKALTLQLARVSRLWTAIVRMMIPANSLAGTAEFPHGKIRLERSLPSTWKTINEINQTTVLLGGAGRDAIDDHGLLIPILRLKGFRSIASNMGRIR